MIHRAPQPRANLQVLLRHAREQPSRTVHLEARPRPLATDPHPRTNAQLH
jgi:hypothetical protein